MYKNIQMILFHVEKDVLYAVARARYQLGYLALFLLEKILLFFTSDLHIKRSGWNAE